MNGHWVVVAAAVATAVVAVANGGGCATTSGPQARPLAGLLIVCEPADAQIYVDDRYLGTVSRQGSKPLMLPVGLRRVELRKEGYFSHFAEVTVARGVQQRITVKLRKEPF